MEKEQRLRKDCVFHELRKLRFLCGGKGELGSCGLVRLEIIG
ncbi:hypothetical protein BSM4216_3513 [Bacillus smithii]|jgi:hypothetical protein|nr:hypothetical protein BSM4216_3513 [Bacillus smithii]